MHQIASMPAVQIFIGTLPMTCLLVWNVIEVRDVRKVLHVLETRVGELAERVSKIEGRIEGRHILVE